MNDRSNNRLVNVGTILGEAAAASVAATILIPSFPAAIVAGAIGAAIGIGIHTCHEEKHVPDRRERAASLR